MASLYLCDACAPAGIFGEEYTTRPIGSDCELCGKAADRWFVNSDRVRVQWADFIGLRAKREEAKQPLEGMGSSSMTDKPTNERLSILARFIRNQVSLADRPPPGCIQLNNDEAQLCAEALERCTIETTVQPPPMPEPAVLISKIVTRYSLERDSYEVANGDLEESPQGEWVRWSDHEAEVQRLRAALALAVEGFDHGDCSGISDDDQATIRAALSGTSEPREYIRTFSGEELRTIVAEFASLTNDYERSKDYAAVYRKACTMLDGSAHEPRAPSSQE
jgi:hypothetical protein